MPNSKRFSILVILVSMLTLATSCSFLFSRYKKEDLSEGEPFKSIVGETLLTKQICYIAKNSKALVKENPYLIKMDTDYIAKQGDLYEVPIGTELTIKKAIYFIKPPGQFACKNVLGSVFIEELNREVKFEFEWEPQIPDNMGEERYKYRVYPLAPWQEKPLSLKFQSDDNSATPYSWPARTTNLEFNTLVKIIPLEIEISENRNFDNSTFDMYRYTEGMHYFVPKTGVIPKNQHHLLQLKYVYPNILKQTKEFVIGNDCRLHLSENFVTVILTSLFNKDTMISSLVNYSLNGEYIDHIVLSKTIRSAEVLLHSNYNYLFTEKRIETTSKNLNVSIHQINENGEIDTTTKAL